MQDNSVVLYNLTTVDYLARIVCSWQALHTIQPALWCESYLYCNQRHDFIPLNFGKLRSCDGGQLVQVLYPFFLQLLHCFPCLFRIYQRLLTLECPNDLTYAKGRSLARILDKNKGKRWYRLLHYLLSVHFQAKQKHAICFMMVADDGCCDKNVS